MVFLFAAAWRSIAKRNYCKARPSFTNTSDQLSCKTEVSQGDAISNMGSEVR